MGVRGKGFGEPKFGVQDAYKFVQLAERFNVPGVADGYEISLFNFDVNRADLKPQHLKWMDGFFGDDPLTVNRQWHSMFWDHGYRIVGETSRTGTDKSDDMLGFRRARSVELYLRSPIYIPGTDGGTFPTKFRINESESRGIVSVGKSLASGRAVEDPKDRQVLVQIWVVNGQDNLSPPPLPTSSRLPVSIINWPNQRSPGSGID
jgi:hypothetical protein